MGKDRSVGQAGIVTASGPWTELVLVCRKCGSKLKKGGYGPKGRDKLPDAIKQALRDAGRRRDVRLMEIGCLGICPRDAVTIMRGAAPGEMLVVPRGTAAPELMERLGVVPAPPL